MRKSDIKHSLPHHFLRREVNESSSASEESSPVQSITLISIFKRVRCGHPYLLLSTLCLSMSCVCTAYGIYFRQQPISKLSKFNLWAAKFLAFALNSYVGNWENAAVPQWMKADYSPVKYCLSWKLGISVKIDWVVSFVGVTDRALCLRRTVKKALSVPKRFLAKIQ